MCQQQGILCKLNILAFLAKRKTTTDRKLPAYLDAYIPEGCGPGPPDCRHTCNSNSDPTGAPYGSIDSVMSNACPI